MIQIKAPISGWKTVDIETAKNYVNHLLKGITTMEDKVLVNYINENKLRGTTVEELFKDEKNTAKD